MKPNTASRGHNSIMRNLVRSIVTAVLIAAAVQCFTVGVLAPRLPAVMGRPTVHEERSLTLPRAPLLRVDNEDGSVRVRTGPGDQIRVDAEIQVYTRERHMEVTARTYVDSLISAQTGPDQVVIVSEPADRPDALSVRVDYTLLVPVGTDLDIEGANGNVWVSKGCGRVTIRGQNTDIEVVEPQGAVTARSTNGRIRVLDAVDNTDIETVNGNIYAHMNLGALRAVTTNGAIVAHRRSPECGAFELQSQNGGITLVMTEDCGGDVDASTGRGAVKSDFALDDATGVCKRQHLRGIIGSGHTRLLMHTLNGNIWLAKGRQ